MTEHRATGSRTSPPSAWATGGVVFAATMMIMIGVFQAFEGLAALIEDQFFVQLPNYAFNVDVTAWGWVHLVLGIIVVIAGFYLLAGSKTAAMAAITLAALSAIANFFFIPYYPFWALLIIAINIFVIWAISRSGIFDSRGVWSPTE